MITKHNNIKEFELDSNYEHEVTCGACIELNIVPFENEKCMYSEKICSRHEYTKHIYGKDWEMHLV